MKLTDLILETQFSIYQAMIQVGYTEDITVQDIGEMLRAIPGVLTVGQVSHDSTTNKAIMKVKILTTKSAPEAFAFFKATSVQRIPEIRTLEVADKTVEKKK